MGPFSENKFWFFKDSWNPIKDTEFFIKHHLFVYKRYILDQNLEGLTKEKRLPCPWQSQNRNGRSRLNFWATSSKFWENSYFLKMFKWYLNQFWIFSMVQELQKIQKLVSPYWSSSWYSTVCCEQLLKKLKKSSKRSLLHGNTYLLGP